jgi:NADPH-dependent 2,4-dienoyl-CoA reductase/sulfur reductase-like enzyme
MSSKMNRRDFLQISGLSVLAASSLGSAIADDKAPKSAHVAGPSFGPAPIPAAKGPRAVVVGGGWSGLTMAKYLKRHNPKFDVVLIDRNDLFISCPMSNLWLADQVDMDFLTHSYTDAAKNHDYVFFNATVIDMDRESKKVFTEQGFIDYDYLVLAPGIDYDYNRIGVEDLNDEYMLRAQYPGGFASASEYVSIKKKLHSFKGGNFVITVPNGNYRCMAAPYERACMAAGIFKKRGVRGKIQLLDMNPDITIKGEGFHKAFETFYPDIIEYVPSTEITSVNLDTKEIETDFDSYAFDDAIIYPPIRASRLIEQFGLHNPASIQKEGNIDQFKYNVIGDEHIYITGDSRAQPFSKSGNTANTEGKYVAEVIAAHSQGKEVKWRRPQTMCFSGVKIDPLEAMSIIAFYKYDDKENTFAFDRVHMIDKWSDRGAQAGFAWAEGMYKDMFYT